MDVRCYPKHHYPHAQNPMRTTFFLLKLSFFTLGCLSLFHFARFLIPSLHHFISYTVPSMWISLSSWLSFPPFLYILLNCIILTIAATSSLDNKPKTKNGDDEPSNHNKLHQPVVEPEIASLRQNHYQHHHHQSQKMFQDPPTSYEHYPMQSKVDDEDDEGSFIVRSNWSHVPKQSSPSQSCITSVDDKPLVSARFTHKKSAKAIPDTKGSPLGIARHKKGETPEYTLKTITDGRRPRLARHLRKSETWDSTSKEESSDLSSSPASRTFRKSQTGRHHSMEDSPASSVSGSPARHSMKREPLSPEEFNRRVEAFILKFNNEIRLQRQNSYQRLNRS